MSDIILDADIKQGFDFSKDKQTTIGFVNSLKIDKVEFATDFTLYNPVDDAEEKVVGVIEHASWSTDKTDAVHICVQISLDNKKSIRQAILCALASGHVELDFKMFQYDSSPDQKKYYTSFSTGGELVKASLITEAGRPDKGSTLKIDIADDPSPKVQQPENYKLYFACLPDQGDQDLHVSVGVGANMVKQWGIKSIYS